STVTGRSARGIRTIAHGDVGGPIGRLVGTADSAIAEPGAIVAGGTVPGARKLDAGPPLKAGPLATGRGGGGGGGAARWAIITASGARSSNTTMMRSRRRGVEIRVMKSPVPQPWPRNI